MTIIDKRHADEAHRLRLRLIAKSMLALAFFAVVFVFLSAFLSGDPESDGKVGMRVDVADVAPGETIIVMWEQRPVVVQRRTRDTVAALVDGSGAGLRDPDSSRSEQPSDATNALRSSDPGWFVAIGLGTDYGCPVHALPANPDESVAGMPWNGGFEDECRHSRYDPAGRVYADQYADRNLVVPPYTIRGDALILGR